MALTTDGFPYPASTEPLGAGHDWIEQLAQRLDDLFTPWTSYTPTIAGLTVGDGSMVAAYRRLYDTVEFKIFFLLGSTSEVTADLVVDYAPAGLDPVAEDAIGPGSAWSHIVGYVQAQDRSVVPGPQNYVGVLWGSGYLMFDRTASEAADANTPHDWDPDDTLKIRGSYQVALP